MGFFDGLLRADSGGFASYPPDADYWYADRTAGVPAGIAVDADGARKLSAWYRGRDLLCTSLAMLPLQVYERLPNDRGAKAARGNPLYDVLHDKPNGWQDSFGWRRQLMGHLIDHGNAYCLIVSGQRGFVHELRPIHPRRVEVVQLPSSRLAYRVRSGTNGDVTSYTQDDIFHLKGPSDDGIVGKGVLAYARDNLGLAMAVERYAGMTFGRGTLNGGAITVPGLLNPEASRRMAESFISAAGDWHLPKVLEQGATWTPNELTPEDFQMILSRKFSVTDIARWLGVPPHMIGDLERATFSNIEQQGQDFVTYSLGPWLSLWEFALSDQLVLNTSRFYCEFQRDALVRGDFLARWQGYQVAVSTGTFTRNEVRRKENMSALDGLDDPLEPAHLTGSPDPAGHTDPPAGPSKPSQKAQAIAIESAARVLRKEARAVQQMAARHAKDSDAFAVAVTEFYADHVVLVSDSLKLSIEEAKAYCSNQAAQVIADGVGVAEHWLAPRYAEQLASIALQEAA